MTLTREAIRAAGIKREAVAVEDWGGDVWVRALSVRERMEFSDLYAEGSDPAPLPADVWLVVRCTCDEKGVKLFEDTDAEWLLDAASAATQYIGEKCLEINGLSGDESAEKN